MARSFSTTVQNIIDGGSPSYFYLIKLSLNTTYYFTSHYHDLVFDGNTYVGDGGLFEFDSPQFSSVVDREAYKVVLADVNDALLAEFKTGVVGKDIEVMVGFMNSNGIPQLAAADIVHIYKGYIDTPSVDNDFEEKTAIVEGTSPMADLDMVKPFITSKDGMDQRSSTDTSFDLIYSGSEIKIKWGKS
jgi:hypothetical protein